MTMRNNISQLQNRWERAEQKGEHWKAIIKSVKASFLKELGGLLETRHACWNLYNQICAFKQIKLTIKRADYESQLLFIKKALCELDIIVNSTTTE